MKSPIIRNGVWATLFILGVSIIPLFFMGLPGPDDMESGEIFGYTSILISMIFVVLGMKQQRELNGGQASYWSSVKTGVLITLFPSVAFGLYNILYSYVIDPDFFDNYAEYAIADRGAGKTAEELEAIKEAVQAEIQMFENPFMQFILMFLTVFIIGLIVSLIAGFFIKKKEIGVFNTLDK